MRNYLSAFRPSYFLSLWRLYLNSEISHCCHPERQIV